MVNRFTNSKVKKVLGGPLIQSSSNSPVDILQTQKKF